MHALVLVFAGLFDGATAAAPAADPLPSWNDGDTKAAILTLVQKVTTPGTPDFVPPAAATVAMLNLRVASPWFQIDARGIP